jgi:transcriptional regulator with XRE-family HTH domain
LLIRTATTSATHEPVVSLAGLKEARLRVDTSSGSLTQAQLAERARLSEGVVKKAERGEPVRLGTALAIAKVLQKPLDELIAARDVVAIISPLIVVRGEPGAGKTTIAATLAHDPKVRSVFEAVLWASLGPSPMPLADLKSWGRALNVDIERETDAKHARARGSQPY